MRVENSEKHAVLKKYFGYTSFRGGQESVIDAIVSKQDVLCVMPTGAGKSLCYQIPALLFPGITLVVSPLISLMKDQVHALVQSGIPAAYINSSLTREQYSRALYNISQGKYKIIYVAPERLDSRSFIEVCKKIQISMVAVDEAHCVSQWGQDFRPHYLEIPDFIAELQNRPVVGAFTATATKKVKEDIVKILKLQASQITTTGFDRPNLYFSVMHPTSKRQKLLELLEHRKEASGIVYCATRKNVEEVCDLLNAHGFSATRYHAGLLDAERKQNQEDFTFDRKTVMVATNAFGMGIDKSNISFVIHYNMPKDLESYYQEAGRAGRDGEKAECILLYSPKDVRLNDFLIHNAKEQSDLTPEQQAMTLRNDEERLKKMIFYSTTKDCLRRFILNYFGEIAPSYCGNCSNCLTEFETVDITVDAQKILSCMIRTGQRFGAKMVCDILRGSENKKLLSFGLQKQSTYALLKDLTEKEVRERIDFLIAEGYIDAVGEEYPVLRVSKKAKDILYNGLELNMKVPKKKKHKALSTGIQTANEDLFTVLRELRTEIAKEEKVPAYVIFSNSTLLSMCEKKPTTEAELLEVSGVGEAKLKRYGKQFLAAIQDYAQTDLHEAAAFVQKNAARQEKSEK